MKKSMHINRPLMIGIAGPSGSGKSSVCKSIKRRNKNFEHVRLDDYFKSPKTFPKKGKFKNWEVPANLNFKLLLKHLKDLRRRKTVTLTKSQGNKVEPAIIYEPKEFILIEGFLLLKDKEIRKFLDIKIYFDLPLDLMIERRARRFGGKALYEYDVYVAIPEYIRHGLVQKEFADYIIDARRPSNAIQKKLLTIIRINKDRLV